MSQKLKWILKLVIPALYVLIAHRSQAQQEPLTIKQAIDIALAVNPALRADSLNIPITHEKNRQLAASYLPQVNYSTNTEYNPALASQMLPGAIAGQPDKDLVPIQFGTRYNFRSGIEVTQTLIRKDLKIQIKAADLQMDIARTRFNLTREELVYQVSSMYYALQTYLEKIRRTRADYINMSEVLKISKAQFEQGILKRIDYESIEINVANLESQLNQLQTSYRDQLAYFNYILGFPPAADTRISEEIASDLQVTETPDYLHLRQDIHLSSQTIAAKQVELNSIRAERLPSLNSYFRYNYVSQFNEPGKAFNSDYLSNSSTLGLSMNIPIFDGNRRKSRIRTAQTELEQLQMKRDYLKQQAEMEVVSSNTTLANHLREYQITQRNLELATRVFNSRKALYTEGVSTLSELLDAERELSKARDLYTEALINVQISRLDVHKANGTLLTEFLKSI